MPPSEWRDRNNDDAGDHLNPQATIFPNNNW